MKIKKKYLGHTIHIGKRSYLLQEPIDDRIMEMLAKEFPHKLEPIKKKNKKDAPSKK